MKFLLSDIKIIKKNSIIKNIKFCHKNHYLINKKKRVLYYIKRTL